MKLLSILFMIAAAALPIHAQGSGSPDPLDLVTFVQSGTLSGLINDLYGGDGILLGEFFGHETHFGENNDFQDFSQALQRVIQARTLFPTPSTVGIVSYVFNEETGTYDRIEGALGPLLAERGTTVGKGRLNVSVNYAYTEFDSFDGNDELVLTIDHCVTPGCLQGSDPNLPVFQEKIEVLLRMRLTSQAVITSLVYGVSDDLDVGLVIPYLRNDLTVETDAHVIHHPDANQEVHEFDPLVETPRQYGRGHASGIGDVVARAKYRLDDFGGFDAALLADLKLPSGNERDFLGTGDTTVRAGFIASRRGERFIPHVNLAYEVDVDETDLSYFDYRLGTETFVTPRLTLSTELLGIYRPTLADEFNAPAVNSNLVAKSEIDGALGAKWKLTDRTVLLLNLVVPLNGEGIRPSGVFTAGVQWGL